jgi:acetyl-CoA carboxylase carboxyl transferase subunit beta
MGGPDDDAHDDRAPGVTPPESDTETSFIKKPKLGDGASKKRDIPKGLWQKCDQCDTMLYERELEENLKVCHVCGKHFYITGRERLQSLVEPDSFEEFHAEMTSVDTLEFTGVASYKSKLIASRKKTGLNDAVTTGLARIGKHAISLAIMNFRFIGGSMGAVVGEKITRAIEAGTRRKLPVIVISASGGARMYEGMFSLMQMAKTCAALAYHAKAKLPYISVLTNPTYAGVMASYASVGDLIIAEPGASIGFAGARVIKDTTQAELPPGFQTSEFLKDAGLIDAIVPRNEMKAKLEFYLDFLQGGKSGTSPAGARTPKKPSPKAGATKAKAKVKTKAKVKAKATPRKKAPAKAVKKRA